MGIYIGLGSNLGDGPGQIAGALERLEADEAIEVLRVSSLYRTDPWGDTEQPAFTNAVAELRSSLEPIELLDRLQSTEDAMGRRREVRRWGPRCIDLDLLLFDELIIHSERLKVPHPRLGERGFVLVPLLELAPSLRIPGLGDASGCLGQVGKDGIERVGALPSPG